MKKEKINLKKFGDLSIGKQLLISFGVVILVATFSSFYMISSLRTSNRLSNELYEGPYSVTSEAMGIRRDVVSIDRYLNKAVIIENPSSMKTNIESDFNSIESRITKLRESIDGDEILIDEVESAIQSLKRQYENLYPNLGTEDRLQAIEILNGSDYQNVFDLAVSKSKAIYEGAKIDGSNFNADANSTVNRAISMSILGSLITILSGIFIAIVVSKRMKGIISLLEEAANKIAVGEFNFNIEHESKDELGMLAQSMREVSYNTKEMVTDIVCTLLEVSKGNFDVEPKVEYTGIYKSIKHSLIKITDELSDTMLQINRASEEVGAASEQVASGAQMLSQGATEQASAIEELSSTIMEVSDNIRESANNAKKANELSISVGNDIKHGNKQMEDMISAMMEISNTSNEISRIIKTIDDIAFQTNILALNAAVEAARAGEAGKGFAVVADEVRNLAAKSAEAASNTAALIEKSINAVETGNGKVVNTAMSLQKIIESTNQTITLIDSIASSSDEQSNAMGQITLGIEQISSVVQTNSATAEESAAASEELSAQAQTLKSRIENFKLKNGFNHNEKISFIEEV